MSIHWQADVLGFWNEVLCVLVSAPSLQSVWSAEVEAVCSVSGVKRRSGALNCSAVVMRFCKPQSPLHCNLFDEPDDIMTHDS